MLHLLDRSLYAELWKAISRLAIVGVWAEADIIYMLTRTFLYDNHHKFNRSGTRAR